MPESNRIPRQKPGFVLTEDIPRLTARPLWEAVIIGVIGLLAALYATQSASDARVAQHQLTGIEQGLELLAYERDLSLAGTAFVTAVTMHMYEGGHGAQVDEARGELLSTIVDTRFALARLDPHERWRQVQLQLSAAVERGLQGFETQRSNSEWISWVDGLLQDVQRVVPTDETGDWSELLEATTRAQRVPMVGRSHLDRVMAVEWRETGRFPRDPDLLDRYQGTLATLRYIVESRGARLDGYSPFEWLILPESAAVSPEAAARLEALQTNPAVVAIEEDTRYVTGLAREPRFPSVQDAYGFLHRTYEPLALESEAIRVEAANELTDARRYAARTLLLSRLGGGLAFLLALAFAARVTVRRRRIDHQLREALERDILTGTANRYALFSQAVPRLSDPAWMPACLIQVDLDHFKSINDTYGHYAGDMAIVEFAKALTSAVRGSTDMVARVGGDEFIILLYRVGDPVQAADAFIERLRQRLTEPVVLEQDQHVQLVFSAGIAAAYEPTPIEELMVESDLALIEAKERGRSGTQVFRRSLGRQVMSELTDALARSDIGCEFQPQLDVADGTVSGCEALLRWRRDDGVYVSARDIVDAIERLGASRTWLRLAMRDVEAAWRTLGDRLRGRIWVNLMGPDLQMTDPEALYEILSRGTTPPERIGVEVAELVPEEGLSRARSTLERIRDVGIGIALDNVGAPDVPLTYVTELPVDTIKLDRCLISGIHLDAGQRALVETLVDLAGRLELRLVAEGVETEAELEVLMRLGVRHVQGFLYAPALPLSDLGRFAEAHSGEGSRWGALRSIG